MSTPVPITRHYQDDNLLFKKKIIFTHDFTHTKARIKIGTSMNLKHMQDY